MDHLDANGSLMDEAVMIAGHDAWFRSDISAGIVHGLVGLCAKSQFAPVLTECLLSSENRPAEPILGECVGKKEMPSEVVYGVSTTEN
ncbi:unnamed protein product [Protopolystoma xenopodis]|uniref:Uncharacterized protein n=1 Tax=Protopolystoma xenopodis TaxID=117903 RepID=A0A448XBH8_9PLAT|nr:unnamed protein product [Protopolystoma xenopodis]